MLSNRCCNILLLLLKSNQSLKLKDIGGEFAISERATRYDLDAIDNFLLKYNFEILGRKTNVGVSCNIVGEERKRLLSAILDEREGTVYDTPTSRLMSVLINLILSKKHIFIDGEAERLLVSRSTVFKDFEKLRQLFNKEKDTLESSVAGYILVGEECGLCLECARVVLSIIESRDIVEIITYSSDGDAILLGNKMYKLFEGVSEEGLRKTLSLIAKRNSNGITDTAYAFCALAISIACKRGNLNCESCDLEFTSEVQEISQPLFGGGVAGKGFISQLLAYIDELETSSAEKSSFPDIQLFAHNMAKKISKLAGDIMPSSRMIGVIAYELIDLVFDDLRGGDKSKLEIDMSAHEDLYRAIKEELQILESTLKRSITEFDIARFYRIFLETYNFDKMEYKRKNVIVLCPFDKTHSSLVAEKIRGMFDVEVFESQGVKALEEDIKAYNADLVVSTLPLGIANVDFVKIGSVLSEEAFSKLKEYLPTREVGAGVMKGIYNILQKHQINQTDISSILQDIALQLGVPMDVVVKNNKKEEVGKLSKVYFESANNYRGALEKAGEHLVANGFVESGYIADMISEVENSKTHMIVMDGVVLAHSRNSEFVKKVGGVLVRLSEKVPFIAQGGEMCDLIFAISSLGVNSHFDLIAGISEVLSAEEKLKEVRNLQSESEVLKIFQSEKNNLEK